jgi:hypothetical protein
MKPQFFTVATALLATAVLPSVMLLAAPAQADSSTTNNALTDLQGQSSNDLFSAQGNNSTNLMNTLMQRALLGPSIDPGTFSANNRENLNDAATAFRAKQQQLLRQRLGSNNNTSGNTSLSLKTLPGGTILLPGALPVGAGSLILTPSASLPVKAVPVTP